ncbi:MAG: pyridoxal-dependent decarboxylase [Acidimicrobiales bacterium]
MTPDEFRAAGHDLIDWIADYHARVGSFPVLSQVQPGEVRARLEAHPPAAPESFDAVMRDVDGPILDGLTHWQSPNFYAYFPANTSFPSILGDLLCAGLGVNGFSWATSPSVTELETLVMDWLVELLALPAHFLGNGVIQDSASSSTLCAILAARHRASARPDQLVAYCTSQAHSSIEKGLRVAGIGPEQIHVVDHDERFAMRPDALAAAIEADVANGLVPFFVCATAGTTSSEAFDPVAAIAPICSAAGAWLHVDAAMCGVAALCPEYRWVNDGVELADSYVTNGHKWMGVGFDCSFFWVRDRGSLIETLSIQPEYLRTAAADAGAVIDYRDWQVPLGRRFRSLKAWFVLRLDGVDAIADMMRAHVALATELEEWVRADERFELLAPRSMNLVCLALRSGDEATGALVDAVNAGGHAQVTPTILDGRRALRVCIGSRLTERHHVEATWQLLSELADR